MTARELLHRRIDELSDAEAESALHLLDARRKSEDTNEASKPKMAPLPQGWGTGRGGLKWLRRGGLKCCVG